MNRVNVGTIGHIDWSPLRLSYLFGCIALAIYGNELTDTWQDI